MARTLALGFLAAAAALILLFSALGGDAAAIGFTLVAAACPFALMALGAARHGRLASAALPIGLALAFVELSLAGMLIWRARVLDGPWLGGLPLTAALLVYGVFLLPLVVVALGFALSFGRFGVAERDLERLRRLAPGEPP